MPSNLPANRFASLVAKAAKTLPADTGATARAKAAAARPPLIILADVSSSMADRAGTVRKIDALRESLDSVRRDTPSAAIVAFATTVMPVAASAALPEPDGGTAMHLALEQAATYRRVLVISDGAPSSEADALRVATRIAAGGTRIDTLFIGGDGDRDGIDFMRRLANVGRGSTLTVDVVRLRGSSARLSGAIRQLALAAPK